MLSRNGWGASAVDAFSTALVMGKWDVVEQILEYVPKIDFDTTTTEVSLFETTIRYLGGLVSGKAQCFGTERRWQHLTRTQPTTCLPVPSTTISPTPPT